MGYRSDVSVVFYTRNPDKLPLAALKLWFDENYPRKKAAEEWDATIRTGDDYVLVTYDHVKWYPDYDHVQAVRSVLDSFTECFEADDGADAAYELIEVGEETNDISETRSDYCDYRLNVRREIIFD